MWQNYKINNFCPVTYFKSQSGFKNKKNHKSTGVFFKQNDEHNIDKDAINNNNDKILQNIYEQKNNKIIMGNNVGQNENRNNIEENNEVENRNRVNAIHIPLRHGNNTRLSNKDENMG